MRWTILAPAVSLAALLATPASAALSDFRLPDAGAQPPVDRQGPVAPDVPESRQRPAPAPTARPAPSPTAQAPARVDPNPSAGAPRSAQTRTARPPVGSPSPTVAPPLAPITPAAEAETAPTSAAPGFQAPAAAGPTDPSTTTVQRPAQGSILPWVLAALAGLGLLGAAGFVWWRWRQVSSPAVTLAPQVERPRLAEPRPDPVPAAAALVEPLQVTLEPLRLSLTLMNATLAYRLEVANRSLAPITGLAIGADMIAAHASMSREEQLSGPGGGAPTVQRIERLEPGESRLVEGEFRVPFTQIVPIRQGTAALLLPLARFRLEAEGAKPLVRTFVVGQPGTGSALQPFRLDQGPRVYPKLAQHAFA